MARKTKAEAQQTRQRILEAARMVFYACGVTRASLEHIAHAAGVTRGAVYWHFQNKEELFFAMREQVALPLIDELDAALSDESLVDPLEGIQRALERLLQVLAEDHRVREVFEIVRFRCEYVDEFADVFQRILGSQDAFRCLLEQTYRRAADKSLLRPGADPASLAQDTKLFTFGLIDSYLGERGKGLAEAAPHLIANHVDPRRA